ncbi:uncharacterized protein [Ptychodera flava]|uniref:uncharacterized protein n=1 Tax=Ptychodera flava TaxID=63121 RepID=UPI003969E8F7
MNEEFNGGPDIDSNLASVELYFDVKRIYKELEELGYGKSDRLKVEDVNKVDSLHYFGSEAVDHAINLLDVRSNHRTLDVGSGLGGPARYIASRTKCHVTALELQEELHNAASDLTSRCGLDSYVNHRCGDFLSVDVEGTHDFLFGWLVFLHIADKKSLFHNCYKALKPGGKVYAEDFFVKHPLSEDEDNLLQKHVYCPNLQSWDKYQEDLRQAGFTDIQMTDLTDDWTKYTHDRLQSFVQNRDRHVRVLGEATTQALQTFYAVVSGIFAGGNVGGARLVATKPQ